MLGFWFTGSWVSFGIGKSIALKKSGSDGHVYVLLSDGELDEGSSIWEGFLFAGHHKISNLTVLIDYNKMQSFGSTTNTRLSLYWKIKSFNLNVNACNGHNFKELSRSIDNKSLTSTNVIICNTIKGLIDFMENKVKVALFLNDKRIISIHNQLINYKMRNKFIDYLIRRNRKYKDTYLLVGDLGYGLVEKFKDNFPELYINVGIAGKIW